MKINKLKPQRVEDLVFVHNNLRLSSKKSPNYNEGESKMWDVRGDGLDLMETENARLLEIVGLSLDEPELEAILFDLEENASI